MNLKRIEITVLCIIVLALGAYGVYRFGEAIPFLGKFLSRYSINTDRALTTIDGQVLPQSIIEFNQRDVSEMRKQLARTTDLGERAVIERHIADRTMALDYQEGMQLLKAVAANTGYPAHERALAVEMIANTYFERSDNSLQWAENTIFNTAPYQGMLSETGNRKAMWDALSKLSEYALSLSALPASEYRLVLWFARANDIEQARTHLEKGDALLEGFRAQLAPEDAYMLPKVLRLRAEASERVAVAGKDTKFLASIEGMYAEARSAALLGKPNENSAMALELVWIDYRYALYLQRHTDGNVEMQKELLAEMTANLQPYNQFNKYLRRVGEEKAVPQALLREKDDVQAMAAESTDLKNLLREAGWQI